MTLDYWVPSTYLRGTSRRYSDGAHASQGSQYSPSKFHMPLSVGRMIQEINITFLHLLVVELLCLRCHTVHILMEETSFFFFF